jgi:tRNA (guanine-N7-)-methyltransferase
MGRNKLKRFEENARMPHVVQPSYEELVAAEGYSLRNRWQMFFRSGPGPVTLELGCGAGEYSVALARQNPDRRYIGVDKKGARFWKGARQSLEEGLHNVAFLRIQGHLIDKAFGPYDGVDEIWLPFPDPQPGRSRERKRLTHPQFLERYRRFCLPQTLIHLKTDNEDLMSYTLEVASSEGLEVEEWVPDVHRLLPEQHLLRTVLTKYEHIFLEEGRVIRYCRFRLFPGSHTG